MALSDWFPGWYGNSKRLPTKGPVAAPTPLEPHPESVEYRRRENGLIGWLRDAVGGWLGPSESHGTRAESQVLSELVRSGPRGVILPWFAPYLDERTGETQQMRLAYRRMWADPNVKAAVLGKILSVCALDLNIIPADRKKVRAGKLARDANRKNEAIAEFVDWNLNERIQGCVPELAWAIFSGGLVDGYSVNEKVWQYEERDEYAGKYVLTALKPKDVGNTVVLQTDDFLNIVGVQALRYSGGEVFSPSNFVIYRHLPLYCSPVGMSDLRAAYSRWWFLDTILKLRAMGLEKRALPVMYGEYETTAQKPSLEAALALVRSQTWLAVPKGVMVKALEIAGGADAMFASAVADLKEDIFLAIQGATLQALAGQEGTMRGSSAVHKTTADLFKWHLARCLEVLLNDRDNGLIRDLVDLNFVTDRYPRAVLGAIDTADLMAEAQLDTALMQMGLKLSKQDAYEKYSRRPPTDPDDELTSPQGGGGAGGAPGAFGGGPSGGDPTKPPEPEGLEPPPMPFAEEGWDESKHARDHGKFAKKGSGSSGGSNPPPSKGASKKERAASTGSGGPDEPAGKGGSSPEPVRVDEPDVIADLSKGENADAGEDWSNITRQAAQQKLRDMATDPHKLRKEAVQVVKKLKTAGETLMGKASAVGKAIYEKGGPVLRQFTDVFHGLGVGLLAGWAYVEHAAESFKHATQAVAKQVAHERGYPPEQVERVAKACAVADGVLAWTVNIPIMHEYLHSEHHIGGWAGFGLAKLGYFMPVASLAFCAYSTVRNPLAMCRAAAKLVTGRGLATSTHHAEDDGPLIGRELVEAVADRMNAAGENADWWHALFSSAFDQTHDARQALAMADDAFEENPEAPADMDDTDASDIAEWLTDYTPPARVDDHDEGGGDGAGGGDTASPTTSGGPDDTVSQFTRATKPVKVEKHAEEFEEFLEEKKDKGGKRYCVEKGKGRVPCPPASGGDSGAKKPAKKPEPAAGKNPPEKQPAADHEQQQKGEEHPIDKLGMGDLRKVGEKAGVKGRSKQELRDKIMGVLSSDHPAKADVYAALGHVMGMGVEQARATGKEMKMPPTQASQAASSAAVAAVGKVTDLAADLASGKLNAENMKAMKMADLRVLGVKMGVKGASKNELVERILEKRAASENAPEPAKQPEQGKPASAPAAKQQPEQKKQPTPGKPGGRYDDLTREQIYDELAKGNLQNRTREDQPIEGFLNPRGYEGFPEGIDAEAVTASTVDAVRKATANTYTSPTIRGVFDAVKQSHPEITLDQFQQALAELHRQKKIELTPHTSAPSTIPDDQIRYVFPLDGDKKMYVGLGANAPEKTPRAE